MSIRFPNLTISHMVRCKFSSVSHRLKFVQAASPVLLRDLAAWVLPSGAVSRKTKPKIIQTSMFLVQRVHLAGTHMLIVMRCYLSDLC
jgi:hypothetical protein